MKLKSNMDRFKGKIQDFFLSKENPESDLLAMILEEDPIFLKQFLQEWISDVNDYFQIKISREYTTNEGRFDIKFSLGEKIILLLEVKKIGEQRLHDKSFPNLEKYLSKYSRVGLLTSSDNIPDHIIKNEGFLGVKSWINIASVLKQRISDEKNKLFPKPDIIYWSKELINYIKEKEGGVMVTTSDPLNFTEAISFGAKNEILQRFQKILEDSIGKISEDYLKSKNFSRSPQKGFQDSVTYNRMGVYFTSGRDDLLSIFYGFDFNHNVNNIFNIAVWIESTTAQGRTQVKDELKQVFKKLEDQIDLDHSLIIERFSKDEWQIIQILIPISNFLIHKTYEEQVYHIKMWLERKHELIKKMLNGIGIEL